MLDAILQADRYDEDGQAEKCAEVAREWIRNAVEESSETHMDGFLKDWLLKNDPAL